MKTKATKFGKVEYFWSKKTWPKTFLTVGASTVGLGGSKTTSVASTA